MLYSRPKYALDHRERELPSSMRSRLSPEPDGPAARLVPEDRGYHQGWLRDAQLDGCRTDDIHSVVNWKRFGISGSRPHVSAVLHRCLCQWEVRAISPSGFCASFFTATVREIRPPLWKANSASVIRRMLNRSTPVALMISSLWPSQKTSVSINHAAGRRHIEHSVTLMG